MNKNEEDKLANAIIALYQEIKGLRNEFTGEIKGLRHDMDKQLAKVNLGLNELRLSYMKLDESFKKMGQDFNKYAQDFNKYAQRNDERADGHETRIVRLEDKSFGGSYIAKEPKVKYTKRKRKK